MPEGVEIEFYRRAAEATVGRLIAAVDAPDAWFLKDGTTAEAVTAACVGQTIVSARRRGKLLILDLDSGERLGLRFGMTGRLVVDGNAAIAYLEYTTRRNDPKWIRFGLVFDDGGYLVINDPRRLGRITLDPDVSALGVDFASVTAARLRAALGGRRSAIKTVLLDQTVVAGLGNMCADEVLWWACIDPRRPADCLDDGDVERLATAIRRRLPVMLRRGGSHRGTLSPAVRAECPPCERDGHRLRRDTIGGRTAVWCSEHQR